MLILVAGAVWVWWTEPYTWQKESSAEELIADLGQHYVHPEYQALLNRADCHYDGAVSLGQGGPMMPESAIICEFDSACGGTIQRLVWHNRYVGAFTSAEPLSSTLFEACREMLLPEIQEEIAMDQGG